MQQVSRSGALRCPPAFSGALALRPDTCDGAGWPNAIVVVPSGSMAPVLDSVWTEAEDLGFGIAGQEADYWLCNHENSIAPSGMDRVVLVVTDAAAMLSNMTGSSGKPVAWASVVVLVEDSPMSDALVAGFQACGTWRVVVVSSDVGLGSWSRIPPPPFHVAAPSRAVRLLARAISGLLCVQRRAAIVAGWPSRALA